MVDGSVASTFSPVVDAFRGGSSTATAASSGGFGAWWIIGIGLFIGIAVISVVCAFVWWYFYEKKQWNIITRVHYENPAISGVSLGNPIPTKRIRFKDGMVAYLYKIPIQGYTISPELLTWTRPREHDIIVTQDKKVFCLLGIKSIDVQRKQLKVDISYPDIEMDRQDMQKHIDSKKYDDPNERFKIIAKVALWIFVIIGVIVVVVIGGKSYIDGKKIDAERDQVNLQTAESMGKTMDSINTFIAIMTKVMPQSFQAVDGKNLVNNNTLVTT